MANETVPIPRTLENPPRTTGNVQADLPILVDWLWRAYQVITQSVTYINAQINSADIEFANLPDPNNTTLAQAQQTANDAYSLANQADGKADDNADDIDTLQELWAGLISGTVTISDTDVGFEVTFGTAQPDTNYVAIVQPISSSGSPSLNSFIVKTKTYATDKFTVIVQGSPGTPTDDVTWEYQIIRND